MEPPVQLESFVAEEHTDHIKSDNGKQKKIFIPTIGTLGDVKPYLVLAQELKKRGHSVCVGVHKRFQAMVESLGEYDRCSD